MTLINLKGNGIQSIERLIRVQMPHLQDLELNQNDIIAVSQLRKAYWPSFQYLSIAQNYICDHNILVKGHFPKLQYLFVYWEAEDYPDKFYDPCFPFKLQNQVFQVLRIKTWRPMMKDLFKKKFARSY